MLRMYNYGIAREKPPMHKFVELMSSQRKVVIIKLAAFVHIGLQRGNV